VCVCMCVCMCVCVCVCKLGRAASQFPSAFAIITTQTHLYFERPSRTALPLSCAVDREKCVTGVFVYVCACVTGNTSFAHLQAHGSSIGSRSFFLLWQAGTS
jgi:hypothetical protein